MLDAAKQLISVNIEVFPCWENKTPAIKNGFKNASLVPGEFWPSELVGVPVVDGVVIIDLDVQKGITPDLVETALRCKLDWDRSLLQHTPSGGAHHAFTVTEAVKQGDNLFHTEIGKGFDTRTAGRGYICTGGKYRPGDMFGVMKMTNPSVMLPALPAPAIERLALPKKEEITQPVELPTGDKNVAEIERMLTCVEADCSRADWLTVAMGLKNHFHTDDDTGWIIFDNWSKSAPNVYDPKKAREMWSTVTPVGPNGETVKLNSIAYMAIKNGYLPSSIAADVFGGVNAIGQESAPLGNLETLIERINSQGGMPEKIDELTTEIRNLQCNPLQRAALTAALQRALRDNGLKISERDIKAAVKPSAPVAPPVPQIVGVQRFADIKIQPVAALGNVHIQNAGFLQQAIFGDRLARFGPEIYWWTGCQWEPVTKTDLNASVTHAFGMTSEFGKTGNVDGTEKQLRNMVPHHKELAPPTSNIFFKNGVYDLYEPHLGTQVHDKNNFNSSTLTIDYTPGTPCPEWDLFLNSIFEEEPKRITLLQEIMGWCLISGNLNHQKAIALDGVPRSGKGTVIEILGKILGTSGMTDVSIGQLADNKSLSTLRAASVATDRDAKRPSLKDMSTVHSTFNKLTANEPLNIPLLYSQEPWRGRLNCKLLIACNGVPVMADDSGASPSRWVVLKFTKSFLGCEDLTLGKRLEGELSAIAAWAVTGLHRLMTNGVFTLPASSIEESHALGESSSPLIQFADDRLEIDSEYRVHGDVLWQSFRQWCTDTNNRAPNRQLFLRSLERSLQSKGVRYKKSVRIGNRVATGIEGARLIQCAEGVIPFKKESEK